MKEDEDYESMEEYFDAEDEALSKAIDEWYESMRELYADPPQVPEYVKIDAVHAAEHIANWGSE